VLGVTVLTSEAHAPQSLVIERVGAAAEAGCGGVICAAGDLAEVRATGHALLAVTPGIRLAGSGSDDHTRVATPARAVSLGADLLVVGRTVTAAPDRVAAARLVVDEVGSALR
jgi:orotidine-5'-phosphate decarboxylase